MARPKYGIHGTVGPAAGFTWNEVRDGWGNLPGRDYLLRRIVLQGRYLNQLRRETAEFYGVPRRNVSIYVTSWYRSYAYDRHVGGVGGEHPKCRATDIVVIVKLKSGKIKRLSPRFVGLLARRVVPFQQGGIGTYDARNGAFTHVDHRPNGPARWGEPASYAVPV